MKVKYGSIITNSRGKLGGQYYSRNHYGAFAANIVTPTNPNTSYQSGVRSKFLYFTQKWRTLDLSDQIAWNEAAPDFPRTDVFGDEYFSTGKNLYVSLNLNADLIGASELTTPPTPEVILPLPPISDISVQADGSGFTVSFEEALTDTSSRVLIKVTPPMSPGIFYVSSMMKLLKWIAQTSQTDETITSDYNSRFSNGPAGQKIFVEIQTIQNVSAQRGVAVRASGFFV